MDDPINPSLSVAFMSNLPWGEDESRPNGRQCPTCASTPENLQAPTFLAAIANVAERCDSTQGPAANRSVERSPATH